MVGMGGLELLRFWKIRNLNVLDVLVEDRLLDREDLNLWVAFGLGMALLVFFLLIFDFSLSFIQHEFQFPGARQEVPDSIREGMVSLEEVGVEVVCIDRAPFPIERNHIPDQGLVEIDVGPWQLVPAAIVDDVVDYRFLESPLLLQGRLQMEPAGCIIRVENLLLV